MQIYSLPVAGTFGAAEIEVSPGNCSIQSKAKLTNAALSGITGKMKLKLHQQFSKDSQFPSEIVI